jgi:hypothetical protein
MSIRIKKKGIAENRLGTIITNEYIKKIPSVLSWKKTKYLKKI